MVGSMVEVDAMLDFMDFMLFMEDSMPMTPVSMDNNKNEAKIKGRLSCKT